MNIPLLCWGIHVMWAFVFVGIGLLINYLAQYFIQVKSHLKWLNTFIVILTYLIFGLQYFLVYAQNPLSYYCFMIPLFGLLMAISTDLHAMIILSPFSLWLAPFGLLFSWNQWIDISFLESLSGFIFGYGTLWVINKIVHYLKKENGIGEGDMELMALVGAFWGIHAACYILWGAATIGIFFGLIFGRTSKKRSRLAIKIPFAPSIALSAFLFHFLKIMEIISLPL